MAIKPVHIDQKLRDTIQGCIRNDRRSQEKLYRQFFPTLEYTIRRYTTDEDKFISIMNNGFLKAFQNIHKYEHRGSFEGWLRKIIFRSVSDYMRSESKDVKFLVFQERNQIGHQNTDQQLHLDDLIKIIQTLPDMQKAVFNLFAIEGYKHSEIAEQLQINGNTSRWYLAEARKELKRKLAIINKNYRNVG
ncbi:MAG: sigma-70 family RNA polymerase sigma factor [Saprospiraceae bacterium]